MINSEFMKELEVTYTNYGGIPFHDDIIAHLWKDFKNLTPEHWKSICWNIVQSIERRPVVADFYRTLKECQMYEPGENTESEECGECGKMFVPEDEERACPKCIAFMNTPEGQEIKKAEVEDWKAELANKIKERNGSQINKVPF